MYLRQDDHRASGHRHPWRADDWSCPAWTSGGGARRGAAHEPPPRPKWASCDSACSILSARSWIWEDMYDELASSGEAEMVAIQYLFHLPSQGAHMVACRW